MKLKNMLIAATLAASTTASFAVGSELTLNPVGPNLFGAVFTQTSTGFFTDTFEFAALPAASTVFVTLSSLFGPANFFVAEIATATSSETFSFFPEDGRLDLVSFQATVAAATPFQLTVLGAATALGADGFPVGPVIYSGAVIAAVPELETYALMLLGLLGVAATVSHQQRRAQAHDATAIA